MVDPPFGKWATPRELDDETVLAYADDSCRLNEFECVVGTGDPSNRTHFKQQEQTFADKRAFGNAEPARKRFAFINSGRIPLPPWVGWINRESGSMSLNFSTRLLP